MAAECTCTERESGRCSRPTVRPGRNVNDEHDHGDGSSTRPRGRWTSGSLTETRVRDSQYLPELFDGSADRTMNPCPLDGTDQRARHVLAAGVEPDGPADADGDQALVIDDARHPTFRCAWGHARAWAGRAASCRARGRNPGTATRLANERSGAGQDLGGRDRLPRVARAVLGRVEQEAERRRRQPGPPYCTCRPQIVAGGRAKLLECPLDRRVHVGGHVGERRRRIDEVTFGTHCRLLRIRQGLATGIGEEPVERVAEVPHVEPDRRRSAGTFPGVFGRHARVVNANVAARSRGTTNRIVS